MTGTLTKAKIKKFVSAAPAGKSEAVLWDNMVTGLGLRVRATGSTSWVFVYRPRGVGRRESSRRVTLGSWPSVSLDAARAAARARAGEVALGVDPAMVLRDERSRERRIVSKVLDEYESTIRRRHLVNAKTVMSTLRRGLALLAAREINALTRKDFVSLIEALENAGKPGAAMDLRRHSRSWLEWAVSRGLIQFNPLAGLRRPRSSRAERLRAENKGRALPDDEIISLWNAADGMSAFGGMLKLALLSGMRRGELAGLRWSDVHHDRIVLGASATKTGTRHEISLTPVMRNLLTAQPRTTSALVFPSSRNGGRMAGWSQLVATANSRSGVAFRLHDLRRTFRTLLSRLGVDEATAELCIGHARRGLIATYNKDTGWGARVSALEAVSSHITKILANDAGAGSTEDNEPNKTRVVAIGTRR